MAHAATAYLPLNLAPEVEARVERLMALSGNPVMSRPIAVDAVLAALPAARRVAPALSRQVRRDLAPWLEGLSLTVMGAALAATHGSNLPQPNQHGEPLDANWQVFGTGIARFNEDFLVSAGFDAYAGRTTPTASLVSLGTDSAQLDIGYRDHWWSPLRDSSMLLSTEAATMPAATLSNSLPVTGARLGYEILLAQMSYSDHIVYNDGLTSGHPLLFGVHLTIEPAPGWSLGISRLMQYGGGDRPASAHDLFRAFFNPSSYDNTSGSLNANQEFGNQQFALSSEFILPGRLPMSFYAEYAAEDTFHAENYRYGNSALSAGLYLPRLSPNLQLRYEFSEWQNGWYVHHIYLDGMTNFGRSIGSWVGDWRHSSDAVGGQSQMLDLTWQLGDGATFDGRYRTIQNASYSHGNYWRGHDLSLSLSWPWRRMLVGASLEGGRDVFGDYFSRVGGFVRFGGASGAAGSTVSDDDDTHAVANADEYARRFDAQSQLFIDAGMMTSRMTLETDVGAVPPVDTTQGSAHLAFGMRRLFSRKSALGARVEFDNVRGRLFTALRAIDYRYRLSQGFAASLFFGAASYAGPSIALGWYGGVGVQWLDVFPRWDIGVDLRYADKLQRDKVTAGASAGVWPDAYYTLTGESIYISRRF